jgi:DNA polymerase III alpha subunit
MTLDEYNQAVINGEDLVQALYSGKIQELFDINVKDEELVKQFNNAIDANGDRFSKLKVYQKPAVDVDTFDAENQNNWFMPEEYKQMDIEGFLVNECPKQNYDRLIKELELFRQLNMIPLLKYIKYLVDTMRENNIVWGVGRGSSVASYVLYLIGVHKIDSIKYELDINEFLKQEN